MDGTPPHTLRSSAIPRSIATSEGEPEAFWERFQSVVLKLPSAPAITYPEPLSYGELDRRACELAAGLRDTGVAPGDYVVVWVSNPVDVVTAALAAFALGAAFIPLDAKTPPARVGFVAQDSGAKVVLTTSRLQKEALARASSGATSSVATSTTPTSGSVTSTTVTTLDQLRELGKALPTVFEVPSSRTEAEARQEQTVAYAIYTSGSTGEPKGVEVTHGNVANFIVGRERLYGSPAVMLPIHPCSFDPQQGGVLWTLATGGSLVLVGSEELFEPARLCRIIAEQKVSHLSCAASLYRAVLEEAEPDMLSSLRGCLVGGEALTRGLAEQHRRVVPEARLFNEYGPTETTVTATVHEVSWPLVDPIPIGTPVFGATCYVRDEQGQLCADGDEGELWIGGAGVARGYLGRPELTAQRFTEDVYSKHPGARLYRTGDKVRKNAWGELEFLGRIDDQIKIRGNRLEPGEIEALIQKTPGVESACVVLTKSPEGQSVLAAFYAPKVDIALQQLKVQLREKLPAYAIPNHFIAMDALPLGLTGKADRKALAGYKLQPVKAEAKDPLGTGTERAVANIWSELLGVEGTLSKRDDFFSLGGHSLLLAKVQARLNSEFGVELSMATLLRAVELENLAHEVDAARAILPETVQEESPRSAIGRVQLAPLQETFYTIAQLDTRAAAYTVGAGVRIVGPLDVERLKAAVTMVLAVHDGLRAHVVVERSLPYLEFSPPESVSSLLVWRSELCSSQQEVGEKQQAFLGEPMDIHTPPLIRFQLTRLEAEAEGRDIHFLTVAAHHIIFDGISVHHFFKELWQSYEHGMPATTEVPSYAGYAERTRRELSDGNLERLKRFWQSELKRLPEAVRIPPDFALSREEAAKCSSGQVLHQLDKELTEKLRAFSRAHRVTPFMTTLAALKGVLMAYTGCLDLVVGCPMAVRGGQDAIPGCMINTTVIRTQLESPDVSFSALLEAVRKQVLGALAHAELPYIELLNALQLAEPRRASRPLFRLFFNYIDQREFVGRVGELAITPYPEHAPPAKFDLTVYAHDWGEHIELQFVRDGAVYSEQTVRAFAQHFQDFLTQVLDDSERQLSDTALEQQTVAFTERPQSLRLASLRIQDRFLAQCESDSARIALRAADGDWSYAQLLAKAQVVGSALQGLGLQSGDRVMIYARRNKELVASIIGCLLAGVVFCVVDEEQPSGVIQGIWEELKPAAVLDCVGASSDGSLPLTQLLKELNLAEARVVGVAALDAGQGVTPLPAPLLPNAPAYAIFTSGTTGKPKGMVTGHDSIVHFLQWQQRGFELTAEDRFSMLSGLGHDPLIRDIFAPLSAGASLCIPDALVRKDPYKLAQWVQEQELTCLHVTPALERVLSAGVRGRLGALRCMFFGGDKLHWSNVRSVRQYAPDARIVNGYGLSETPQLMAFYEVADPTPLWSVPLGGPIPGVRLSVEDANGRPCAANQRGEIVIRTGMLALGYLKQGEVIPFDGGQVLRTGDYGRLDADGRLHFVDRADRQVKVRGHRVELLGVEQALLQLPHVRQAHVLVKPTSSEVLLRAFVVVDEENKRSSWELRNLLKATLPDAAVPQRISIVESLPLTPNGKVDSQQLLLGELEELPPSSRRHEARTQTEELIISVWEEVLALPDIRLGDDFFGLGGSSLQAVQMLSRVSERLGSRVPLDLLLRNPTVREFAHALFLELGGEEQLVLSVAAEGERPPFWMFHPVGGHVTFVHRFAAYLDEQQPVFGVQARGVDGVHEPISDMQEMAELYIGLIRERQPKGPYYLGGPSFGGRISYEIAQQLTAQGEEVALLVMFDTWAPGYPQRKKFGGWLKDKIPQYARRVRDGALKELYSAVFDRKEFGYSNYKLDDEDAASEEATKGIMNVVEAIQHASRNYQVQPYQGHVIFFRAAELPDWVGIDFSERACGWAKWASSTEVIDIPCNHRNIMDEPALQSVAAQFRERLEEAQARHQTHSQGAHNGS